MTLIIPGRLCGHTVRTYIIEFGKFNLKYFQRMGMLLCGVPSEPTLCRVENGIEDTLMTGAMQRFSDVFRSELTEDGEPDIICMEGKVREIAELKRHISFGFTRLMRFLGQK